MWNISIFKLLKLFIDMDVRLKNHTKPQYKKNPWTYDLDYTVEDCVCLGCILKHFELENLGALKCSLVDKLHIFQCVCKIFCAEFQVITFKLHKKYHTHAMTNTFYIQRQTLKALRFKSSYSFLKKDSRYWDVCEWANIIIFFHKTWSKNYTNISNTRKITFMNGLWGIAGY